jgi:hypothetical protein
MIAAMRAGVGIGGYHIQLARRSPDLVRVLAREFRFEREMWLAVQREALAARTDVDRSTAVEWMAES